MLSLAENYKKNVVPKLLSEFGIKNVMAVPKFRKVVINMGIGLAKESRDEQEKIVEELGRIAGQKPSIRQAKKSIPRFGTRQGQPVGVAVTLRGKKMNAFLQKLFNIVLPRLRDFRGVSRKSFDGSGNYTLGILEHTVFPEIDLGKVSKVRGFEITIVINSHDKEKSLRLLEEMGMPFMKDER